MTDRPDAGPYRHEARLEFSFVEAADAKTVERSLSPEVGDIDDDRSRATIDRSGGVLAIDIDATDLVALRAATNTWTTFVDVAHRTLCPATPKSG